MFLCASYKIKIKVKKMSFQSILSTEIDLLDDSDEEKESKRDLLLACVLAGEYLFEEKERRTFYVRIEWEKHNQELAVEGPEAFQNTEWNIVHS